MQTAAGGPLFPWKQNTEWTDNWKFRTTPASRSRVLSGKGVETDKQYTERRKKETTKRTWRSDAADIAHGIGEGVLALHPYTAIPYFGAKVGQDFLNGTYGWHTALNASIPLFHMAPQSVGLREATNVALEDVANAGSKTARNLRVAREIKDNVKQTKLPYQEYSPIIRTKIGDVEINDPQLFYRQGPVEMGEDFIKTGVVNPGTEYVNPMFARGKLFYGLGDAQKTTYTPPAKGEGIRLLLAKPRVDKPKPDLIITKAEMFPANAKSRPIKEIIEKDNFHPFSEKDYKTYTGMEDFMDQYNSAYYNGEFPDYRQIRRITHEQTRTVPKEQLDTSNATLYRYKQGYGYKKITQEPSTSLAFFERKPSTTIQISPEELYKVLKDQEQNGYYFMGHGTGRTNVNPQVIFDNGLRIKNGDIGNTTSLISQSNLSLWPHANSKEIIILPGRAGNVKFDSAHGRIPSDWYDSKTFQWDDNPEFEGSGFFAVQKPNATFVETEINGVPGVYTKPEAILGSYNINTQTLKLNPKSQYKFFKQGGKMNILEFLKNGSGIHIKKKNRGKFTSYCGGKVTDECIQKGKHSSNPAIRKRATFAANARKWKHKDGGVLYIFQEGGKTSWWNKAINFVNNSGLGEAALNALSTYTQNKQIGASSDVAKAQVDKDKASKIQQANLAAEQEARDIQQNNINSENPNAMSGDIVKNFIKNKLLSQKMALINQESNQEKAEIDWQTQQLKNQNTWAGIGSALMQGLGHVGQYLGNKQQTNVNNT